MSDALKRRCLHLYIDFPNKEQELAIVQMKVPEASKKLAEEVVGVVQSLRKLDLKKTPGISETLDWVKALTLLNVQSLDKELVNETLDTIVKYEGDVRKAQEELKEYLRRARARRGTTETSGSSDKDLSSDLTPNSFPPSPRRGHAPSQLRADGRRTIPRGGHKRAEKKRMEEKLVEFANLLRENGVRVSLAETLDAFGAAEVTGLGERTASAPRCALP